VHPHDQSRSRVRLEWGAAGARLLGPEATVSVVVDVLSFTTTLTVALDRGATVFPYRWADGTAASYAEERDAVLAVGRRTSGGLSLSPVSIRDAASLDRLVLPSPNGSSISALLAEAGCTVLAASLRNRTAVADAIDGVLGEGGSVALVPAGERWPDDSLRPAVEDLWGAGAVAAVLEDRGHPLSEEAGAAAAAFRRVEPRVDAALRACSSGRELVDGGFPDDVDVAGELDLSRSVPGLGADGAFVDVSR
jgi:2-phosphosulfolactate phosphatase